MTDHTPTDVIGRLNAALEGRYRIERELGAGGMATVYLAEDVRHDRKVAIKVLRPELAAVIGGERFVSEIKTTANLQHPHILPLHDSGEADGFLFYVMPFVEGESLREKLNREKQLPVDEALGITLKVAAALQAAHEKGIVHRDIKPANILLSGGEPLVADFGIALAVQEAGGGRLTETGLSLGTPFYMSPEQASADRQPTPASDVYSLGCVLYEMLIGDPPHTGSTAQAVLAKILTERPRTLSELRSTVPPHVAAATARALERLPADRFPSVQEFARALGDPGFTHVALPTASGTGPHPATVEARPPRGSRLPWLVAAAAVACRSGRTRPPSRHRWFEPISRGPRLNPRVEGGGGSSSLAMARSWWSGVPTTCSTCAERTIWSSGRWTERATPGTPPCPPTGAGWSSRRGGSCAG
jgi:serine/threonine-protein kinase